MSSEQHQPSDKPAPDTSRPPQPQMETTTEANGGTLAISEDRAAVPTVASGAAAPAYQEGNAAGPQGKEAVNAAQREKAPITNAAGPANADAKQQSEKQQLAEVQDAAKQEPSQAPPLPPKKGEEPVPEKGAPPQAPPQEEGLQTQTQGEQAPSAGSRFGKAFRTFVSSIHGAGDTIRGKFSAGVDSIFGHQEGVEKNQRIAQQGMEEMRSAKNR